MIRLTDFWGNKTHFGYILSEPITDTTHAHMQKSDGTQPVSTLKAKERLHASLACFCCLQDRSGRVGKMKKEGKREMGFWSEKTPMRTFPSAYCSYLFYN